MHLMHGDDSDYAQHSLTHSPHLLDFLRTQNNTTSSQHCDKYSFGQIPGVDPWLAKGGP